MNKEDIRIVNATIDLSDNKQSDLYNIKNFVTLVNKNRHLDIDLVYRINNISNKNSSYIEEVLNFIYSSNKSCKMILQLDDYDMPKYLMKIFATIAEVIYIPITYDFDTLYDKYSYINSFNNNCEFMFKLNDNTVNELSKVNNFLFSIGKKYNLHIDIFNKESSLLELMSILSSIEVLHINNPIFLQSFLCPDPAKELILLSNGRVITDNIHKNDDYYLAEFKNNSYDFSMFSNNYIHNIKLYYERTTKSKCANCPCIKYCKNGLYGATREQEQIFCSTNEILNNFFKEQDKCEN